LEADNEADFIKLGGLLRDERLNNKNREVSVEEKEEVAREQNDESSNLTTEEKVAKINDRIAKRE